ncbi:MAG: GNAT family N-acetyltransferase [Clostridia bacterium]|nr:GNAT family N-acetyltransferase [Clostridia bacterium]
MIEMKIAGGEALKEVFALRKEVFCDEQGYPEDLEFDQKDENAVHLYMIISGETVAAARIVTEGADSVIGRICVKRDRRGEGLGRAMVLYAVDKCRKMGVSSISVMSEIDAVGFYEGLGFSKSGERYFDGHLDRQPMSFDMKHSFGCC